MDPEEMRIILQMMGGKATPYELDAMSGQRTAELGPDNHMEDILRLSKILAPYGKVRREPELYGREPRSWGYNFDESGNKFVENSPPRPLKDLATDPNVNPWVRLDAQRRYEAERRAQEQIDQYDADKRYWDKQPKLGAPQQLSLEELDMLNKMGTDEMRGKATTRGRYGMKR